MKQPMGLMSNDQVAALLFALAGAFFITLAIAPLAIFDRFEIWGEQARWFRANGRNIGAIVTRILWGVAACGLWTVTVALLSGRNH